MVKILNQKKIKSGFSLIELIIYIALIAIFVTGAIMFAWNIIYGKQKALAHQVVELNAKTALTEIEYEIKKAKNISSISANSLTLETASGSATISLNSGVVELTTNTSGPVALTSNQVYVTDLIFSQPGSTNTNTRNINVELKLRQKNTTNSEQFQAEIQTFLTTELNSQFNSSRKMLVNLSAAALSANKKIINGITIQNSGTTAITIDKIHLMWDGGSGTENVTEIQIGGGTVEWTGSQPTGSTLDITNFVLNPGTTANIDNISFDSMVTNLNFNFEFIMLDSSSHKANIAFGSSIPTPSPTPTPTPTPTTCSAYCITQAYSAGTCRSNAQTCVANGEVNESGGNVYCTGGQNADTCCCAP